MKSHTFVLNPRFVCLLAESFDIKIPAKLAQIARVVICSLKRMEGMNVASGKKCILSNTYNVQTAINTTLSPLCLNETFPVQLLRDTLEYFVFMHHLGLLEKIGVNTRCYPTHRYFGIGSTTRPLY